MNNQKKMKKPTKQATKMYKRYTEYPNEYGSIVEKDVGVVNQVISGLLGRKFIDKSDVEQRKEVAIIAIDALIRQKLVNAISDYMIEFTPGSRTIFVYDGKEAAIELSPTDDIGNYKFKQSTGLNNDLSEKFFRLHAETIKKIFKDSYSVFDVLLKPDDNPFVNDAKNKQDLALDTAKEDFAPQVVPDELKQGESE